MEIVKLKLKEITEAWNYYFLEYKYCQGKIRFDDEVKTNYYGDVFQFFDDTLDCINEIEYYDNFQQSIFQSVGILQIIYAQQDLIDELLYIFKIQKSESEDKNPNRKIRNELIGHPIRRKPIGNDLISSVFFGHNFNSGNIHYVLYSKTKDFIGESIIHHLDDIISRHNAFLIKYLDIIWKKIMKIIRQFKKELETLKSLIDSQIPFNKLIDFAEQRFESIFKYDYLFKKEHIMTCFQKISEHPRYSHAVELFIQTLRQHLSEKIQSTSDILVKPAKDEERRIQINVQVVDTIDINTDDKEQKYWDYEFSKLHEKHPLFNLMYFRNKFKDDVLVIEEIDNMQNNQTNEMEYNSSYEYLRFVLTRNGLLRSRSF